MNAKKMVIYIYIYISIICFLMVGTTTAKFVQVIPGIIFLWLIYVFFSLGYNSKPLNQRKKISQMQYDYEFLKMILNSKFILILICSLCSLTITYFYTGKFPVAVYNSVMSRDSLYSSYQLYFQQNELGFFSLSKVPFILMNYFLNIIVVFSFINDLVYKNKIKLQDILYLFSISCTLLYFGLARGTNFELFIIVFLTLFCIFIRRKGLGFNFSKNIKNYTFICGIVFISYIIFESVVNVRYSNFGLAISREIRFDANEIIPYISMGFALTITRLAQYFSFGVFYTSSFFDYVMIENIKNFVISFLPFSNIFYDEKISVLTNNFIDQSTNWIPDLIRWVGKFGWIGTFLLIFVLGFIAKWCEEKNSFLSIALLYFVVLQIFSLPIGNFVVVLSANKIIIFTLVMLLILRKFKFKWR